MWWKKKIRRENDRLWLATENWLASLVLIGGESSARDKRRFGGGQDVGKTAAQKTKPRLGSEHGFQERKKSGLKGNNQHGENECGKQRGRAK